MLSIYRPSFPAVRHAYWPQRRFFGDFHPDRFFEGGHFPKVEVKYENNLFTVVAELPGMDKDDVHVDVQDGVLTLKGEKRSEYEEDSGQCRCSERYYGSFERSFELPSDARYDEIEAHLDKGVLTVKVPVPEGEEQPKKIEVTVQ